MSSHIPAGALLPHPSWYPTRQDQPSQRPPPVLSVSVSVFTHLPSVAFPSPGGSACFYWAVSVTQTASPLLGSPVKGFGFVLLSTEGRGKRRQHTPKQKRTLGKSGNKKGKHRGRRIHGTKDRDLETNIHIETRGSMGRETLKPFYMCLA